MSEMVYSGVEWRLLIHAVISFLPNTEYVQHEDRGGD